MATTKQTTVRLNPDALRVVNMHLSGHPNLTSMNDAINDLLARYGVLVARGKDAEGLSADELISILKEQGASIDQLILLALRSYALSMEVAKENNPVLLQQGEARAKELYKQIKKM